MNTECCQQNICINKSHVDTNWRWTVMRFAVATIILTAGGCLDYENNKPNDSWANLRVREYPFIKKERSVKKLLDISNEDRELIWNFVKLPKNEELGLSFVFHYWAVYSLRPEKYQNEIAFFRSIIQQEKKGKEILGDPVFRPSKFGIAMVSGRTSRSYETHRDQGLAELGLLGIPSTFEIEVSGRKCSLKDAIRECIANFYLNEKELAWSATVLALYLPPQKEWINRFGEQCTFEVLVDKLLQCRFEDNSCAGVHLLEALTLIYEVSLKEGILLREVQQKLREHLRIILDTVIQSQDKTGYWRLDWFNAIPDYNQPFDKPHVWTPPDDKENRLLATCHLVEWMLGLPDEFEVPDLTLLRSGEWMLNHLRNKNLKEPALICPYGHAVRDLELLSR
ncbi:MAG: hypothetical protein LBQ50_05385 [Planctomycetaceae bacterium]|jgi:hypothetical protein|nr:hypothetical protein [Planctomycetaceae bacterium]